MKSLALLVIVAVAPSTILADVPAPSPSSSPVTSMQNMPSQEQIFKLFQKRAAQARESLHRFRVAMLDSLMPDHRAAAGAAIAKNVLAATPDKDALVKTIDGLLSENERERVAAAMTAYVAEQEAMRPAFEADFAHEFPDLAKGAHPSESVAPLPATPPSASATILANWLLAAQPRPIETMTFAQSHALTPFTWSGPDTDQYRQQMRSGMLGALSPSDRPAIADAIAAYAVSADPDEATLAKRIDALLTAHERQRILDAYAQFSSQQKTEFAATQARFKSMSAQMPPDAQLPFAAQSMSDVVPDAGTGLVQMLLGGGGVTASFYPPGTDEVAP